MAFVDHTIEFVCIFVGTFLIMVDFHIDYRAN